MIGRFFKKTNKQTTRIKKTAPSSKVGAKRANGAQKLLTAEGWKRLMMRKKAALKPKNER